MGNASLVERVGLATAHRAPRERLHATRAMLISDCCAVSAPPRSVFKTQTRDAVFRGSAPSLRAQMRRPPDLYLFEEVESLLKLSDTGVRTLRDSTLAHALRLGRPLARRALHLARRSNPPRDGITLTDTLFHFGSSTVWKRIKSVTMPAAGEGRCILLPDTPLNVVLDLPPIRPSVPRCSAMRCTSPSRSTPAR